MGVGCSLVHLSFMKEKHLFKKDPLMYQKHFPQVYLRKGAVHLIRKKNKRLEDTHSFVCSVTQRETQRDE